jgi:hypothetical protein
MNRLEKFGYTVTGDGNLIRRSSNPWWGMTKPVVWIFIIVIILELMFSISMELYYKRMVWSIFFQNRLHHIWIPPAIMSPFLILSLLAVYQTTLINPTTRAITIIRRRLWGKSKLTLDFSMDSTRIEATRMGVTDANPHDVWIVKAGVVTDRCQLGILSKETTSVDECKKLMLDLHRFFYPTQTTISEDNIINNGSQAYVLSDAEKIELEKKSAKAEDIVNLDELQTQRM